MKKTAIILIIALALALATFALSLTGCDDKDNNTPADDPNEVKERTATVSLFGGLSTVTVKGNLTKPQLDDSADKIKNRLNTAYDAYEAVREIYIEIFARGVTFIVEANPVGYENIKTIGDGKTIYIALDKVDTTYVTDGVGSIGPNGSVISKATPTANKGATT